MAEKITRKAALEYAINGIDNEDVAAVLKGMLEQISKPRKATVSKVRVMNENLAKKVAECFPSDGGYQTTKNVVNMGFPEIATTQKAAAVLKVACELGLVEKVIENKNVYYRVANPCAENDSETE